MQRKNLKIGRKGIIVNEEKKSACRNQEIQLTKNKQPFLLYFFFGILVITYIIWSSVQTYSNELHYDMD